MEKCVACGKAYNRFDPTTYPPTCSEGCWWFWINVADHRNEPCWIQGCLEVYCGIRTEGYCYECDVFKVEQEIKRLGLNKKDLIGNY